MIISLIMLTAWLSGAAILWEETTPPLPPAAREVIQKTAPTQICTFQEEQLILDTLEVLVNEL